ncbi:hypothetical protein N5079_21590 [Planotetraspora sp. A-T 1434]|uniref:hypothetical protein n=1 Tax=Planotetraspora sp. A-T 1434 TaxID=2979219 RepID=UPI0021BF7433|nr:hypothetical protein [Planotetraspora sp. A-T 1434]MCT9932802.1 hypothetical protein [Planotetraspora sp. A-T 1434]
MNLDEAADRLYGMAPGEFTAARDGLAKEAKAAGDVPLSREIGGLRKPTVVGWAVNQSSRRHPDELDELLDVGRRLREAWHDQDAEALAELTRQRSALTGRLARMIREDAEEAGQPLSGSAGTEIEQTLDAAVVDEEAAAQVRQGRLVRGLSYSGFAPAPIIRPARPRSAGTAEAARAAQPQAAERRAAERERRIRELERSHAEAGRAATEAEEAHASWEAELAEAVREHDRRAAKVAELSEKLAKAREKLAGAGHRLDIAKREETRTARAARSARFLADRAEAALKSESNSEPAPEPEPESGPESPSGPEPESGG